jgi:hypothetical protein
MTATAANVTAGAQLADRLAIAELSSSMCLLVDSRDWAALEELFDDPVRVDYTSLFGGEVQSVSPPDLVGGWREILGHLDATHHLIGGHVITIDGKHATCAANVQGTHMLANEAGGPLWTVGGRYDMELTRGEDGWRICALTLTARWVTGNRQILQADTGGGR